MAKHPKLRKLTGALKQLLYSPKGGLEGLLICVSDSYVQVSMVPGVADALALADGLGLLIEVTAEPDHSPKTKDGSHPVFRLGKITKLGGKVFQSNHDGRVKGVITALHYAKHGEPNGVILESGEFIHTRPHGMKKLKLRIGSTIVAHGEQRTTVLGTCMLEASKVNRVAIV